MITSLASLISCLDSAYLCSLILCALEFLGNAKLFYSHVPYRSCHYGELLIIRKSSMSDTTFMNFSCLLSEQRFPSPGSQTPCPTPLLTLVVSCCDCACLFVLSIFLHKTLFSPSLYS